MLQSAPPVLTRAAVHEPVGWYVEITDRFAAIDDEVVETVLVFPKLTGALVISVKSPLRVIPSRLMKVDADGVRCQTANVPVSEVLCAVTYVLKSLTAVVESLALQFVIGVVVG